MTEAPPDKLPNDYFTWKNLWSRFRLWEKIALAFFLLVGLFSSSQLIISSQQRLFELRPAFGGIYREGVVGQPRFLNPLYAPANNPDLDIVELVFSGLMKYDARGNLVPDLAQKYELDESGRVYQFTLRENLFWHDHEPLTVDDVIFTIHTIQNPDYKSPLRAGWLGVKPEKISDREIKIVLDIPYAGFIETATTKIIPRHIWKETPPLTFPLAVSSTLSFIGSGPYRFQSLSLDSQRKVQSLNLEFFDRYHIPGRPYIAEISFRFYENEEDLWQGAKRGEIDGFALSNPELAGLVGDEFTASRIEMPRYFSIFFNPGQSQLLAINAIRQALTLSTNKEDLVAKVVSGQGRTTDSPILPEFYGFEPPKTTFGYNPERAAEIFDGLGYKLTEESKFRRKTLITDTNVFKSDLRLGSQGHEVRALQECLSQFPEIYPEGEITGNFGPKTQKAVIKFQEAHSEEILAPWGFNQGTGLVSRTTRTRLNEVCFPADDQYQLLEFTLTTIDQPHLVKLAQAIKDQWSQIGARLNVNLMPLAELESQVINPRNYEMLLLGQVLGIIPDPLAFWHSSRKREPGVNLALYQNEQVDQLLEQARATPDERARALLLEKFQNIVINDFPAIFFYQPDYIHFISPGVQGRETERIASPPKRFSTIVDWYLRTRRSWNR